MKKAIYLLIVLLGVVSCDQMEFDEIIPVDPVNVSSRATISVPNVIDQLDGIPLHIKVVGLNDNKFLSVGEKNDVVGLYSRDDGSMRQRFYIKKNGLYAGYRVWPVGGNRKFKEPIIVPKDNSFIKPTIPLLKENVQPFPPSGLWFYPVEGLDTYYIKSDSPSMMGFRYGFLQAETNSSSKLIFDTGDYKNNREKWEIIPIEDFELISIRYFEEENDKVSSILKFVRSYELQNKNSSTPTVKSLSIKQEFTETANFLSTSGLNINHKTSSSYTYSSPEINQSNTVSNEIAYGSSWTYQVGTSQSSKIELTDTFTKEIPAYTDYKIELYVYEYKTNISYVGEFRAKHSGKIIKLKGKFNGTQYSNQFVYIAKEL